MKIIIIKTQQELDALPERFEEYTRIEIRASARISINKARENSDVVARENSNVVARGNINVVARENINVVAWENSNVEAWGNSNVEAWGNSNVVAWGNSNVVAWENSNVVARGNSNVVARENSNVVAWGNSNVVARENSNVVARENSNVVAWGKSNVVAREKSNVEAWGNSNVEARENSNVVARENSNVVAWENSNVVAWGKSLVRVFSSAIKLALHGFSILSIPVSIDLKFKYEKTCLIQRYNDPEYLDREGISINRKSVVLYKKVSADFKTQEKTKNETLWILGSVVTHPRWEPEKQECGEGKFHAVSRPYFADEFRNNPGDKYIAITIKTVDLYEWPGRQEYPHKIAFRKCTVLYEVDKFGKKIGG